jgi:hypothetical protein
MKWPAVGLNLTPYRGPIDAPHAFDAIWFVHLWWWLVVVTPFLAWLWLTAAGIRQGELWWAAMFTATAALLLLLPLVALLILILWPLFILPMVVLMALAWITAKIEYHWRRRAS